MITILIPGYGELQLSHLVLDYNGTLACDGKLIKNVREQLVLLSETLKIHVITADSFGKAREGLAGIPCSFSILKGEQHDVQKLDYVLKLGAIETACIGNGRNDRLMIKKAALGIVTIQDEGAATETMLAADLVVTHINCALDLLLNPVRLKATLRC